LYVVERKMKAEQTIALTYSEAMRLKFECEGKLREEAAKLEALDDLHLAAEQERVDALEARAMWEEQLAGQSARRNELMAHQVEVLSDQVRRSADATFKEPVSQSKKRRMRELCTAMRRYLEVGFTINVARLGGSDDSASLGSASNLRLDDDGSGAYYYGPPRPKWAPKAKATASASQASMGQASMGSALVDSNSLGSASAGQGQASMGSASVGSAAAGLASMGSASAMVDNLLPALPSVGALRRARRQRSNARFGADEAQ
jgi:hypothetical protein